MARRRAVTDIIDNASSVVRRQAEDDQLRMAVVEKQSDRKVEWRFGVADADNVAAVLADVAENDLVRLVIRLRPFEFVVQRHRNCRGGVVSCARAPKRSRARSANHPKLSAALRLARVRRAD